MYRYRYKNIICIVDLFGIAFACTLLSRINCCDVFHVWRIFRIFYLCTCSFWRGFVSYEIFSSIGRMENVIEFFTRAHVHFLVWMSESELRIELFSVNSSGPGLTNFEYFNYDFSPFIVFRTFLPQLYTLKITRQVFHFLRWRFLYEYSGWKLISWIITFEIMRYLFQLFYYCINYSRSALNLALNFHFLAVARIAGRMLQNVFFRFNTTHLKVATWKPVTLS